MTIADILKHLKDSPARCKACGAELVAIRVGEQHCSGEWNELIAYRCGAELAYCPNFESRGVYEARKCDSLLPKCTQPGCARKVHKEGAKFCGSDCAEKWANANA